MRRGRIAAGLCTVIAVLAGAVDGSEVDRLTVGRSGSAYTIDTAVLLSADAGHVRAILASPELLPELNGHVQSVEALPSEPGASTLRIVSRRCVLLFCRDYTWDQTIWVDDAGDEVSARIVPSVELPPLIGPALMRNALADDMTVWSANIARLSREATAGDRVLMARSATPRRMSDESRSSCTHLSFC